MRNDFKGSEELLGELRRGPSGFEELGFDEYLLANLECRRRHSAGVGRSLILLLCLSNVVLEVFVKFFEVDGEFVGASGGEAVFGVDGDFWMETFVSEEGGDSSGCTRSIVVREFGKGQEVGLIVLLIITICAEVLFERLIHPFGLAISLGVIPGGEVEGHVEGLSESAEEP